MQSPPLEWWLALGHLAVVNLVRNHGPADADTPTVISATPAVGQMGTVFGVAPRLTGQISGQADLPGAIAAGSLVDTSQRVYLEALP